MIRLASLAVLVLAGCCGLLMAQEPPAKQTPLPVGKPVEGDAQDFVFLDATRPVFIRLHVQIDGVGFRKAWASSMEKSFDDVDTNGDGKVTLVEMRVASQAGLLSVSTSAFAGVDSRGGHVTREEWVQWARRRSGNASDVRFSFTGHQQRAAEASLSTGDYLLAGPGSNPAKALFRRLDVNGDKVLTEAELTAAGRSLHRLDLNDDEMIAAEELQPYANPPNGQFFDKLTLWSGPVTQSNPVKVYAIPSAGSTASLAAKLLNRYDGHGSRTQDGKLTRKEIGWEPAEFHAADADASGNLDALEVEQMLRQVKPQLALVVRLGNDAKKLGKFARVPVDSQAGKAMSLRTNGDGTVTLDLGTAHLQFTAEAGANVLSRLNVYLAQFKRADRDNNGYLDKKEAQRSAFGNQFALMDRNKNDMLYPDEMASFMTRRTETSLARVSAHGTDRGKLLFDVMDANRDRRLSARELAAAPAKLPLWDRNRDGKLVADEIPHQYVISIGRGKVSSATAAQQLLVFNAVTGQVVRPRRPTPTTNGPTWFVKMDRNRDGDVSPREFLGSAEDFRRFDVNRDGLIDPGEATRDPE